MNKGFSSPTFSDPVFDDPLCSTNPLGEYVYTYYDILVPDKHDGVVNIHSVLWTKGDGLTSSNNQLFDDIAYDGGYNHFELRNYARAYNLPSNENGEGFSKGDKNPAMEFAKNWAGGLFD